jgi:hypothetical protein
MDTPQVSTELSLRFQSNAFEPSRGLCDALPCLPPFPHIESSFEPAGSSEKQLGTGGLARGLCGHQSIATTCRIESGESFTRSDGYAENRALTMSGCPSVCNRSDRAPATTNTKSEP